RTPFLLFKKSGMAVGCVARPVKGTPLDNPQDMAVECVARPVKGTPLDNPQDMAIECVARPVKGTPLDNPRDMAVNLRFSYPRHPAQRQANHRGIT
ncbi:MAG: hypothetical protein IKC05_06090, partial [Lentisphaeria bacterium]|nr:hypothetical protein [Lentisphaeria bacterium]